MKRLLALLKEVTLHTQLRLWITMAVLLAVPASVGADVLYSTDFASFSPGTIDGQDGWTVNPRSISTPFDWGVVIDDGTGNQVLEVRSGFEALNEGGFGGEVKRSYDTASERFLRVEMDFRMKDADRFFFMDNGRADVFVPPDSLFWFGNSVFPPNTNASGIFAIDSWHNVTMVIDQELRGITSFSFDGTTVPVVFDSTILSPDQLSLFLFSGAGSNFADPGRLWIDNLSITNFAPEPSTFTLLGIGAFGMAFYGWRLNRKKRRAA